MIEKWVKFCLAEFNAQLIELFEIPASASYSIYMGVYCGGTSMRVCYDHYCHDLNSLHETYITILFVEEFHNQLISKSCLEYQIVLKIVSDTNILQTVVGEKLISSRRLLLNLVIDL